MDEKQSQELIEIGNNLALFTLANLFIKGGTLTLKEWQEVSDMAAKDIEKKTGMPAEDFALKMKPVIDLTIKQSKERE